MVERVLRIGEDRALVGILTEPARDAARDGLPTVMLLNAGLIHRVGPHRLHVTLARRLAALGFPSVRLDLGGIGDSDQRRDSGSFEARSAADTRMAMDYLAEHRGASSFILGGLCAGADTSSSVATDDPRVTGLILLDWYAYRTRGYYVRHYGPRVFKVSAWTNKIAHLLRAGRPSASPDGPASQVDPAVRRFPPRRESEARLRALTERGVRLLFVYTGGQGMWYNHAGQFPRMFPSVDPAAVRHEFFSESDHTFTLLQNQRRLESTVTEWIGAFLHQPTPSDEAPARI